MKILIDELSRYFLEFYEKYPQYKKRKTYFIGDSYAGHYIPAILEN